MPRFDGPSERRTVDRGTYWPHMVSAPESAMLPLSCPGRGRSGAFETTGFLAIPWLRHDSGSWCAPTSSSLYNASFVVRKSTLDISKYDELWSTCVDVRCLDAFGWRRTYSNLQSMYLPCSIGWYRASP